MRFALSRVTDNNPLIECEAGCSTLARTQRALDGWTSMDADKDPRT